MPDNIYEVVAQGARYWFLFLMALIVWRSWRWYRKDKKKAKKRLKLLPDAGFVGEMVVLQGGKNLERGVVMPVPREGTLGSLRTNDLYMPLPGVDRKHLWFRFDDDKGLMVEPFGKNDVQVDGEAFRSRRDPLYMAHGSRLVIGEYELRLRLFAGFEAVGHAQRQSGVEDMPPQEQAQTVTMDQAQMQLWMQQQFEAMQRAAYEQAYQQGYQQAMQQQEYEPYDEYEGYEYQQDADVDALPFDMAQIAQEEGMVDHRMFMRPEGVKKPEVPVYEQPVQPDEDVQFYAPVADEDWADEELPQDAWSAFDEDMTDAAAPPKSAYVGHDEAETAKRQVWDKYFGGGQRR